jgi:hypothetical protein
MTDEPPQSAPGLLADVLDAHGGLGHWRQAALIQASLSCGGLAFAAHGQGHALHCLKASVHPHARRVVLHDFSRLGWRGVWTPSHVTLQDDGGAVVAQRHDPRQQFSRWVKQLRWDQLDILYFAGYALWNYLSFPFLLASPGVRVHQPERHAPEAARRLVATFPAGFPTHSAVQTFHLSPSLHLMRHDYTAQVIGPWAHAAHTCLASETAGGLRFYTRRVVHPRLGRRLVLPWPRLVWIELGALRVSAPETVA